MNERWKSLLACLAMLSMFTVLVAGCPMSGGNGNTNTNDNTDNGNDNGDDNGNDNGDNNGNDNGGDENPTPEADAGPDQNVTGNSVVMLEGTGTDQNSDDLTFTWTQIAGTAVDELIDADTEMPMFTAPNVSETLTFRLTVSDGNTSDTDEVDIVVTAVEAFLFVVNETTDEITSYNLASGLDGPVLPTTVLNPGAATSIFQPRAIAITPEGRLLIGRQNGGIAGFNNALTATMDTPADFVVEGTASLTESPIAFAYDPVNDRLFVGNAPAEEGILVFDGVSQWEGVTDVAPTRTFSPPDRAPIDTTTMTIDALYLDHLGNLYVSDTSGLNVNSSRILVFNNLDTAEDSVEPVRTITSTAWMNIEDLVVDENDVLYIVDGSASVFMFEMASMEEGEGLAPEMILTVDRDLAALEGIAVGEDGTGYVSDRQNHKVYSYFEMATLDELLGPNATLEGNETELFGPRKLFLFQP